MDNPVLVRARDGAAAAYVAIGVCVGVWSGSIPALQLTTDLTSFELIVVLVTFRLAGVVTMQVVGRLADRRGTNVVVAGSLTAVAFAWVVTGAVPTLGATFLATLGLAVLAGSALGALDVSVNAHAVNVAHAWPRQVFGFLHGMFAVGALVGSGLTLGGATLFGSETGRFVAFVAASLIVVASLWVFFRRQLPALDDDPTDDAAAPPDRGSLRAALPLSLMALCVGVGEGAAFDWSALHVQRTGAVPPQWEAAGLMCVTLAMLATRFVSDALIHRWGRPNVVLACAVIAVAGYFVTMVPVDSARLAGWCLVGLGVGALAPQVYGAAGQQAGGRGVALVLGGAYVGILSGPAIVGAAIEAVGIAQAMAVPAAAVVALAVLVLCTSAMRGAAPGRR